MKFEIQYWQLLIAITVVWIIVRAIVAYKNKKLSWKRELQMLLVYICIIVIMRIVNFPMHHVDGKIAPMKFDSSKILPLWFNPVPIVHLFDVYDGWQINIIGNITMFIPVGIVWPICFKELDKAWKAILAGVGFTFCIEVTQLLFYERCSDVDDLILNSLGAAIGVAIVFLIRRIKWKRAEKSSKM